MPVKEPPDKLPRLPGFSRILATALVASILAPLTAQALPDRVADFSPGINGGFGAEYFPANVLGPPQGTTNSQIPNASPEDLLSLGTGGSITYEFNTHRVIDGPGADLTVFENPVQPINYPEQSFVEAAIVAVSKDGVTWHTFPFDIISTKTADLKLKSNYSGFAGVQPTFSSTANGISPFDPAVSGGDQFDLADLGLDWVRFVRITDTGHPDHNPVYDLQGDLVTDFGNLLDPHPGTPGVGVTAGFDIDAIAAIHTETWPPVSCISSWYLYE